MGSNRAGKARLVASGAIRNPSVHFAFNPSGTARAEISRRGELVATDQDIDIGAGQRRAGNDISNPQESFMALGDHAASFLSAVPAIFSRGGIQKVGANGRP